MSKIPATLKGMVLYHISPRKNRESILLHGLKVGKEPSGYGVVPTVKGIYFYHEDNIDIIYDAINTFEEFDVWEVSGLLGKNAVADEDSGAKTWRKSMQSHGTLAYTANITTKLINLKMTITSHDKQLKLQY